MRHHQYDDDFQQPITTRATRTELPITRVPQIPKGRTRPKEADEGYEVDLAAYNEDAIYSTRKPSSVVRRNVHPLQQTPRMIDLRTAAQAAPQTETLAAQPAQKAHRPPIFHIGVGIAATCFVLLAESFVINWTHDRIDDLRYGRPRTFQVDVVVGHFDSSAHPSHFTVENLDRHVLIYETPGGNAGKTIVYEGPILTGPSQDLTACTISFSGGVLGHPNMLLQCDSQIWILVNVGDRFAAQPTQQ